MKGVSKGKEELENKIDEMDWNLSCIYFVLTLLFNAVRFACFTGYACVLAYLPYWCFPPMRAQVAHAHTHAQNKEKRKGHYRS